MSGKLQRWGLSPASASRNNDSNSSQVPAVSPQRPSGTNWNPVQSGDSTFTSSDTSMDRIPTSRIHAPLPMNPDEAESYDAAKAADNSYASSSSSSRPGSSDGVSPTSFSGNWHMTPIHEMHSKPWAAGSSAASSTYHPSSLTSEPLQDTSDQHAPGFRNAMRHARQFYSSLRRNVSDGSETHSHNEDEASIHRPPQAKRGGAFWRSKLGTNLSDAGDSYEEDTSNYSFARRYPERVAAPSTRHVSAPQNRSVTANSTPSLDSEPERHLQRTDSEGSRKSFSSSVASNARSQSGSVPGSRELPLDVVQAVTASIAPMQVVNQQESLEVPSTSPETSWTQSEQSASLPSTTGLSPPAVAAPALIDDVQLSALISDSNLAAGREEKADAAMLAVDSSLSPKGAARHSANVPLHSPLADSSAGSSNSAAASSVAPRPSVPVSSSATNTYDIATQRSPNPTRMVPLPPSDPSTDSKRALFLRARTKSVDHFQRLFNITKHGSKDAHRSNTKKLRKPEAARTARVPSEPQIPEDRPIGSTGQNTSSSMNPAPIEEAASMPRVSSEPASNPVPTFPESRPMAASDHQSIPLDMSVGSITGSQLYGASADTGSQANSGGASQPVVPRTPLYDASSSMSYFDLPPLGGQTSDSRSSPALQRSTPIPSTTRRTPSNASANARASPKRTYPTSSPSVTRSASGNFSPTTSRDPVSNDADLTRSGSTGTQSTHTVHSARSNPIDESSPSRAHSNEEVAAQIEHMLNSSMPTQTAHDAKQSMALHASESPDTMLWNNSPTNWDDLAAYPAKSGGEMDPDKSQGLLEGLRLDERTNQSTYALEETGSPASLYSQVSTNRPTASMPVSQSKPIHSSASSDTKDEIDSWPASGQKSFADMNALAVASGNGDDHNSLSYEELWWPVSHAEDDPAVIAPRTPNMRLQRRGSGGRHLEPLNVKIPPSNMHATSSSTSPFSLDRPATASSVEGHTQFPSSSSGTSTGPTLTQAWSYGKPRSKLRTDSRSPSLNEANVPNIQDTPSRRATEELLSVTPTIVGPQSASPLRHHWEHDVDDDEPQTMVPRSLLRPSKSSSLLNAMAHPAQRSKAKRRAEGIAPMPSVPVPPGTLSASGFLDMNTVEDDTGSSFGTSSLLQDDTQEAAPAPAYPPPPPPPPNSLRRKGRLDHSPPIVPSLTSHKSAVDLRSAAQSDPPHANSAGTISSHPSSTNLANSVALSGTPSFEPPLYRTKRNKSQPTLRIADDHEFLQALEQVRSQHQKRIALRAQARTARKASMPNLRQTSPVLRRVTRSSNTQPSRTSSAASGHMREEEEDGVGLPSHTAHANLSKQDMNDIQDSAEPGEEQDMSQDRNSSSFMELDPHSSQGSDAASVDSGASDASVAHVNEQHESQPASKAWDRDAQEDTESIASSESSLNESIANELGIGQATGNTPSKPFTNDADWKKEVKALFLIRELVQTERSYARHLESLLIVVLKWTGTTSTSTRMQTNVLMPSLQPVPSSSRLPSGNAPPPHLLTLRKMLPQLISLSRALVYRIEESPSSVGVAHAFIVIRDQLEEVHVAWSKVVSGTLRALRITESSKSRAKGRLGLVPVLDPPHTETPMPFRRTSSRDDSDIAVANLDLSSERRPEPRIKSVSKEKELSPVDVAIMPTQRIPRYCLLLRDLLSNTNPDSPSYATLETALQNVQELGRLCDEASSKT